MADIKVKLGDEVFQGDRDAIRAALGGGERGRALVPALSDQVTLPEKDVRKLVKQGVLKVAGGPKAAETPETAKSKLMAIARGIVSELGSGASEDELAGAAEKQMWATEPLLKVLKWDRGRFMGVLKALAGGKAEAVASGLAVARALAERSSREEAVDSPVSEKLQSLTDAWTNTVKGVIADARKTAPGGAQSLYMALGRATAEMDSVENRVRSQLSLSASGKQ